MTPPLIARAVLAARGDPEAFDVIVASEARAAPTSELKVSRHVIPHMPDMPGNSTELGPLLLTYKDLVSWIEQRGDPPVSESEWPTAAGDLTDLPPIHMATLSPY
jgi:hypothetical protein